MPQYDNDSFGRQVESIVDDALGSLNFDELNDNITGTIQGVFDELNIPTDMDRIFGRQSASSRPGAAAASAAGSRKASDRILRGQAPAGGQAAAVRKPRFIKNPAGGISGIVHIVCGAFGTFVFGISTLICGLLGAAIPRLSMAGGISAAVCGPFLGLSIAMLVGGFRLKHRVDRFNIYKRTIGDRNYCSLDELAAAVGKDREYVLNDLRKMMRKEYFYNAHLDRLGTTLMLDDEAYKQYSASQSAYDERMAAQHFSVDAHQIKPEEETMDPELAAALKEGNEYLRKIQEANAAIPGPEITRKLDRLEQVITRIFDVLKAKPDQLPKLRKFMNYYMPTTIKLVQAYRQLDAQGLDVENVRKSKAEIERTLDTINLAYEKLLDSFFEADAIDIKSDISVLETMMAQEGLAKADFH